MKKICALLLLIILVVPSRLGQAQEFTGLVAVSWSPDGTMIAGGGPYGLLKVWDTDGNVLIEFPKTGGTIAAVAWNPDSTQIASSASGSDKVIRVWNVNNPNFPTGELIATFEGHRDMTFSISWSPDGSQLASGSIEEGIIKIWDTVGFQEEPVSQQSTANIYQVAWNPNGRQIAIASGAGVLIFPSSLGIPYAKADDYRVGLNKYTFTISWSPDGTQLASGDEEGNIGIWDVSSKELLRAISGHTDYISALAWNLDGLYLASASADNTVAVWDIATGRQIGKYSNEKNVATLSISWSPDGEHLAYGGNQETAPIIVTPLDDFE